MGGTFLLQKNADRLPDIKRISAHLAALSADDTWRVKIEKHKAQRSDEQNSALWGVAYKFLAEETGNDPEQMHQYFCIKYFGPVERQVFGMRKLMPRRTTTTDEQGNRDVLSKLEFAKFYESIQRLMAMQMGLNVPDPDPSLGLQHKEK